MKTKRKNNKQGISLIVLVITIIVMIILAAAIILSLSSNGIIDRANEAVEKTDKAQVQILAETIWADAYLTGKRGNDLKVEVSKKFFNTEGITKEKYRINVTDFGINVEELDPTLNFWGTIPEGGVYYVGVTTLLRGDYTGYTEKYEAGSNFPNNIQNVEGCPLKFESLYQGEIDGEKHSIAFSQYGKAAIYADEEIATMLSELSYNGTSILMSGAPFATVTEDGEQIIVDGAVLNLVQENVVELYTPKVGDVFVYGDYEYRFGYEDLVGWIQSNNVGWAAVVLDKTKSSYGEILESINGAPVVSLRNTFGGCENMTSSPKIPSTIVNMTATFGDCTSLTVAPLIPNSVKKMGYYYGGIGYLGTFSGCTSLKTYVGSTDAEGDFSGYIIPSSVTTMYGAFNECTSITVAPNLGKCTQLTDVGFMFRGCTSLTGTITLNSTPTIYEDCLNGTQISGVLGTCRIKDEIMATK